MLYISMHIKFDKMIVEMTKTKSFYNRCITVFNYFSRRYKHYYKYYSTKFNINSTKISLFFRQNSTNVYWLSTRRCRIVDSALYFYVYFFEIRGIDVLIENTSMQSLSSFGRERFYYTCDKEGYK